MFNIDGKMDLKKVKCEHYNTKGYVMYDSIYMKNSDQVNPWIQKADCSCQKLGRGSNGK